MKKILFFIFYLLLPCISHALTLSQMRDNIRIIIKDTDATRRRYSDAQLLTMMNEGQRDINNSTWIVSKSTAIILVSGTTYYSIPSDVIEITRLTREYKSLDETSLNKLDSDAAGSAWELMGGTPVQYFQDATIPDRIGINPFPNNTSSTGTLRLQYIAQPLDLSSDTDIPFNASNRYLPYHDLIVYYVCTRIFMLEGDTAKLGVYSQLYESRIQVVKEKVGSTPNFIPSFSGIRK
jgi:hypothetical protein